MKIPEKPIKELSPEERIAFLESCRNHSEMAVALELIFNKERVYTSEEVQSMLKEKMTQKDNSENTAEVVFYKKKIINYS